MLKEEQTVKFGAWKVYYSHSAYASGDSKQEAGVSEGGPTGGSNFGILRMSMLLKAM